MLRGHGQVVNPASVSIESGHDRGHDLAIDLSDEKKLRLFRELTRNILARIVPRPGKPAALPQRDHAGLVFRPINTNFHSRLRLPHRPAVRSRAVCGLDAQRTASLLARPLYSSSLFT